MSPDAPPQTFALLGVAGFVAPRHLAAMSGIGGELLYACDPHDSVGVLDRYFPRANYVRRPDELRQLLTARREQGEPVDYVTVCTPNDLHEAHIRLALESGSRAICEKPLLLEPTKLESLLQLEQVTGLRVHPILQLREHPELQRLRADVQANQTVQDVELRYITSRGPWYQKSWKGDERRSGGVISAIGIHFLDFLLWAFGRVEECRVFLRSAQRAAGELRLERARVRWFLSLDEQDLPPEERARGQRTFRRIRVNGSSVEFSQQFDDLHQAVYRRIVRGEGPSASDAGPSLWLADSIRRAALAPTRPDWLMGSAP